MRKLINITFVALIIFSSTGYTFAQNNATIYGTVKHNDKEEGIPAVNVIIKGSSYGTSTDVEGKYRLSNIKAGTYTIIATAIGHRVVEKEIIVASGEQAKLDFVLENISMELGEVTVYGASFRKERITEAPASVSILNVEEIKRNSGNGQLAKLLENEPGIDIAQSGLFDFNINARGFNSSLNRRLLILLDGRDLGTAFLGATEWNGLSIPLEELGRIELVRGPGSALYGANAYNGVVNISSLSPRSNPGTRISIAGGEKSALRGDVKYGGIAGPWSYRINAGWYQGKSFAVSRLNNTFEYDGLHYAINNEVIPLITDPVSSVYGSGRIDYDFEDGGVATIEGGLTQVKNEVIVTGIGRVQVQQANKPFGRINYNGHGFNFMLWSNGRNNVKPERSLSTGLDLIQNASITHAEIQYNFNAWENKLFLVFGGSHRLVNVNTEGTLMLEKRNDNMSSLFSQAELKFTDDLKIVGAARLDRSTLHTTRVSPKLALVWSFANGHSLRATFNKAFQPANYSEQYLYVKRPTTSKSSILYQGNPNLVPEEIMGYELGYKGIFSNQLFLTMDIYYNQLQQFITDLGPTGRGIYDAEKDITYAIWSYNNAGKVDEYGTEVSANFYLTDYWMVNGNFSLFKFNVVEIGTNDILIPNTPEYKINAGITYSHPDGHSAEINFKYVPTFPWAAGIFRDADIKSYTTVNLAGTYHYSNYISFNLNISNLLDNRHYEILGGSLLGRRAILTATFNFM